MHPNADSRSPGDRVDLLEETRAVLADVLSADVRMTAAERAFIEGGVSALGLAIDAAGPVRGACGPQAGGGGSGRR